MKNIAHVVPAILEKEIEPIQQKVELLQSITPFVQLDVMDNIFVPNSTFMDPAAIALLDITIEVHLMIDKPSLYVQQWALPNVSRIIVHQEASTNMEHLIELLKRTKKEIGIAINPSTSTHALKEILFDIDMVVVMGVEPGFSGQEFQKDTLEKIYEIKSARPEVLVEVDGGVNRQTAQSIVDAGADVLAAASAFWNAENIAQEFDYFSSLFKK